MLSESVNLATFGLRPDLATPVLAVGFLAALVCYAPQRPVKRMFTPRLSGLTRVLLAIGAMSLPNGRDAGREAKLLIDSSA